MSLQFFRRKFRSFMNTAHVNGAKVQHLEHWLIDKAGLPVWHTTNPYLDRISADEDLADMLGLCQSAIILLTQRTVESGWVKKQYDAALVQKNIFGDLFPIVPIQLEDCDIPDFFRDTKCVNLHEELNAEVAAEILFSLYSTGLSLADGRGHTVYLMRTWSEKAAELENKVCASAKRLGFRLIVDPDASRSTVGLRENVLPGCGGGIAIIPDGTSEKAVKRILSDLKFLASSNIPYVIVYGSSLDLPTWSVKNALACLTLEEARTEPLRKFQSLLRHLQDEWMSPQDSPYIFWGTNLKDEYKKRNRVVRHIIQQVTSMPCSMGEDIQQGQIQQEITNRIINAKTMVADISKENINTCIEAGIALGANVPVFLVSGDERHKPPFMFRDRQIWHYQNDLDLIGIIHKLVLPYRRWVM